MKKIVLLILWLIFFASYYILTNPDYCALPIESCSMEPAVKKGSLAIFKLTNEEIKEGEIVLADKHKVTCHRLKKIIGPFVILKGDRNKDEDEPILKSSILGWRYIASIPLLGYFNLPVIGEEFTPIIIILELVIILAGYMLLKNIRDRNLQA